jgi:hypothetical protein
MLLPDKGHHVAVPILQLVGALGFIGFPVVPSLDSVVWVALVAGNAPPAPDPQAVLIRAARLEAINAGEVTVIPSSQPGWVGQAARAGWLSSAKAMSARLMGPTR